MKFPRLRIHLLTAIILQIELGVLIWANATAIESYDYDFSGVALSQKKVSYYGWPFKICSFAPGEVFGEPLWYTRGLILNCCITIVVLSMTWVLLERLPYKKSKAEGTA